MMPRAGDGRSSLRLGVDAHELEVWSLRERRHILVPAREAPWGVVRVESHGVYESGVP